MLDEDEKKADEREEKPKDVKKKEKRAKKSQRADRKKTVDAEKPADNAENEAADDGNVLPQNILMVGEKVDEDKNIYISQRVYRQIHKFTEGKTKNEAGGILAGNVIEEFGKTNIIINAFIEAKDCEATPTTLKFTHKTWEGIHAQMDKKFKDMKIVGWIHTHPDFGIFLSEYDKFIQDNFFKEDFQVAYVVDPIQSIEGFYFRINGSIERCRGFYIFDKIGAKITAVKREAPEPEPDSDRKNTSGLNTVVSVILALIIIFLGIMNIRLSSRVSRLEAAITELGGMVTRQMMYLQDAAPAEPTADNDAPAEPTADNGTTDNGGGEIDE